jgi:hypothetical protein
MMTPRAVPTATRRLVISVCPREAGVVALPIRRGERRRRLNAEAVAAGLEALARERGLTEAVRVRAACAGGCSLPGPNVSLTAHPPLRPGERPDHVAVAWRSYVASLARLDCLARILDDNLEVSS